MPPLEALRDRARDTACGTQPYALHLDRGRVSYARIEKKRATIAATTLLSESPRKLHPQLSSCGCKSLAAGSRASFEIKGMFVRMQVHAFAHPGVRDCAVDWHAAVSPVPEPHQWGDGWRARWSFITPAASTPKHWIRPRRDTVKVGTARPAGGSRAARSDAPNKVASRIAEESGRGGAAFPPG
jgi:hypothetical protein